ncbi:MAG: 1-aminocyclopropane-1-carboxylate deaminase/D-cysteine desulfhydrase [Nitrospinota bacterium]
MAFSFPPKVELARLPTRIEELPSLSERLGARLYIKRDDETGFLLGGNKVRKLEYLLQEALEGKHDTVVTCGGVQSNHARATAVAARRLGMDSFLILRGAEGAPLDGNLLLDRLVGGEVRFVTPEEYRERDAVFREVERELRARGRNPYLIPEGGSNALGALGYASMVGELKGQLAEKGLSVDAVICADGSGGTHAGLLLGRELFGLEAEVFGVNVCDDAPYFVKRISAIMEEARERFGLKVPGREEIRVIDGYVGEGYALNTREELSLIAEVARTEGVILDGVYTAKAFRGMVDQLRKNPGIFGRSILFLHTGGVLGLFPKRRELAELL